MKIADILLSGLFALGVIGVISLWEVQWLLKQLVEHRTGRKP